MYSFLKAFLVLMKLLSLSQFYAPIETTSLSFHWTIGTNTCSHEGNSESMPTQFLLGPEYFLLLVFM